VLAHHDKAMQMEWNAASLPAADPPVNDSLKTLLIVAFLLVIVWQLGAGLYYLLTDRGDSKRTVNALTRRIALSVALILLVILGIYSGWIKPHGL
jgi:succinate dehydrogenase/fumarate reductase cytochrome b subunit